MIKSITVVELDSFTKERPRTNFYTKAVYTPKSTIDREKKIAQEFLKQNKEWEIDPKALKVRIEAVLNLPIVNKKETVGMLDGTIKPLRKPDVDNVAKLVLDALNGVAYVDDKQIVELNVIKKYGNLESKKTKKKFLKIEVEKI